MGRGGARGGAVRGVADFVSGTSAAQKVGALALGAAALLAPLLPAGRKAAGQEATEPATELVAAGG